MARTVRLYVNCLLIVFAVLVVTTPLAFGQATTPPAFQCPNCNQPANPPPVLPPAVTQALTVNLAGQVGSTTNTTPQPLGPFNPPNMRAPGYPTSTPGVAAPWSTPVAPAPVYTSPFAASYNPSNFTNSSNYAARYYQPAPSTTSQMTNRQSPVLSSTQLPRASTEGYGTFGSHPADIEKAQQGRQRALELSEAAGDKIGEAINHAALAQLFVEQGDPGQAIKHLNLAEPLFEVLRDPKQQADLFRIKGAAYLSSGQFDEAITAYRQAIPIVKSLNDQNSEAQILTTIGWVYQSLGEPQSALKHYEEALPIFVKAGDKDGEARTRFGIGLLHQSLGELNEATEQYRALAPIASRAQLAALLSSIGEFYQSQNRFSEALQRYEKALALIRPMDDRAAEAGILAGIGRCQMGLGASQKAQELFDQARLLMAKAGNRAGEAGVIASIGELDYWNGISSLNSHLDFRGRYFPKALKHYNDALALMREASDRTGEIGVLTNIGLVYDAWAKPRQALSYYTQALQKLDELQTYARLEEFRIDVAGQSANLYERAILLAVHLKQTKDAFDLSERARARTFLDQLGNKKIDVRAHMPAEFAEREQELQRENISLERQLGQELAKPAGEISPERVRSLDLRLSLLRTEYERLLTRLKISSPEYTSFLSISPLTLSEAQRVLAPDITLISYFVTPELTLAFVVTRDKVHVAKVLVRERQLALAVATFLDFPGQSGASPSLTQLDRWLIAPIRSQLRTSMIAVVPHSVLHNLSFAALTPDGRQYLGDSHEIFYLPSVSALPYIRARTKPGGDQMLVLANDKEEGLPYLGHAYGEARAIASVFGTQPRLGDAATASVVRTLAGDYDILHLIAHIEPNNKNSPVARIMLAPGQGDEGPLELHQVYGLDLRRTNLVVLSGCQSELGRQSRGDDIVGLSRAFIYAGAPSVIASLWSIDDAATQQFMISFYEHLKHGMSKAEALGAAQVEIRRTHPNPYYWAGFVLTGDPGLIAASS